MRWVSKKIPVIWRKCHKKSTSRQQVECTKKKKWCKVHRGQNDHGHKAHENKRNELLNKQRYDKKSHRCLQMLFMTFCRAHKNAVLLPIFRTFICVLSLSFTFIRACEFSVFHLANQTVRVCVANLQACVVFVWFALNDIWFKVATATVQASRRDAHNNCVNRRCVFLRIAAILDQWAALAISKYNTNRKLKCAKLHKTWFHYK